MDLSVRGGKPGFEYREEGGWRDTKEDTVAALAAAAAGRRTKTALSNQAFSTTPLTAWEQLYLAKSCGELLAMQDGGSVGLFSRHECSEGMTADEIARERYALKALRGDFDRVAETPDRAGAVLHATQG